MGFLIYEKSELAQQISAFDDEINSLCNVDRFTWSWLNDKTYPNIPKATFHPKLVVKTKLESIINFIKVGNEYYYYFVK